METRMEGAGEDEALFCRGVGRMVRKSLLATELWVRAASHSIGPELPAVPFHPLIYSRGCESDLRVKSCPGQSSVALY